MHAGGAEGRSTTGATITATGVAYLNAGMALYNQGLVDVGATGEFINAGNAPVTGNWTSTAGGLVEFTGDLEFDNPTLSGLVQYGGGTATGTITVPANTTFDVLYGVIRAAVTVEANGTFEAANPGWYNYGTSGPEIGPTLTTPVTGAGTVRLLGATLDADITAGGPRLVQAGAVIDTHHIPAGATLELLPGAQFQIASGATLVNDGTLHFDDSGTSYISTLLYFDCDTAGGNPGALVNHGRVELGYQSVLGPGYTYVNGQQTSQCTHATASFQNSTDGTIAPTSLAYLNAGVALHNQGLVDVGATGEFINAGNAPVTGNWTSTAGGLVEFTGDLEFDNPTLSGLVQYGGGTATGTITVPANTTFDVLYGVIRAAVTVEANGTFEAANPGWYNYGTSGPEIGPTLTTPVTGAGTVRLLGATLDADITAGGPRLVQAGAVINTHHIPAGATLELLPGAQFQIASGATLVNDGTLHFDDSGTSYISTLLYFDCDTAGGNPGALVNHGRVELGYQSMLGPGYTYVNGQQTSQCVQERPAVTNYATLATTGGTISVDTYNHGLIDVANNSFLQFAGYFDNLNLIKFGDGATWSTAPLSTRRTQRYV